MADKKMNLDLEALAKKISEEIIKKHLEASNLNIMIAGKTGAGKSTLINAVFGKEFAKTGSGEPITQNIEKYSDGDELTIYDTKGLEINDHGAINEIRKFISEQESKDPSDHIHLAWVCIAEGQRRVEEADVDLFKNFKDNGVPVMVIITKASQDTDEYGEKFSDIVKKVFSIKDNQCQRVMALAIEDDDGNISEVRGIKELTDKSWPLLDLGRQNALQRKQAYDYEMKKQATKKDALNLINDYSDAAKSIATTSIPLLSAMIAHINSIYGIKMDKDGALKTATAFFNVISTGLTIEDILKHIPIIGGVFNVAAETTTLTGKAYVAFLDDHYDSLNNIDIINLIETSSLEQYKDKASNL